MSVADMAKPVDPRKVENLVFKGGSVKGVAYVGAIAALETIFKEKSLDLRSRIKNVGGTSAGAITALLIALNYTLEEVIDYLINTDLKSFLSSSESRVSPKSLFNAQDEGMISQSQMLAGALMDLNTKFGLYSGLKFLEWLENLVKQKTGIDNCTFAELHDLILADKDGKLKFKDLHVIGFNLSSNTTKVFNYQSSPNTIISDAVRISMSIPIVFLPHNNYVKVKKEKGKGSPAKEKKESKGAVAAAAATTTTSASASAELVEELVREILDDDMWLDGGITNNYPVRIFDSPHYNERTLGFFFASPEEMSVFEGRVDASLINCIGMKREIKNGFDYARALMESLIDAQQIASHLHSRDPERTVYINHLNVSGLNFGLTLEEKQSLVNSGWDAVHKKFGRPVVECPIKIDKILEDAAAAAEDAKHMKERCNIA